MNKLDKTFKINPLYEADGYKIGHKRMLAENTVKEYWTWIPRSLKYLHKSIDKIMSGGQQLTWRYIHSNFKELFFDQDIKVALQFGRDMSKYLNMEFDGGHFEDLHKLGYLPVKIKALPEGIFTGINIPHMTGINTIDGYAWLGLFLETLVSKLSWQFPITATLAHKFKQNAIEWTTKTDKDNLWLTDYMCHDFHSRGGNPFTSIAVGLAHATCNLGSDTINVIPAARYYYDVPEDEVCISSVNASEHSVTCTGIFYYEDLLKRGERNKEIAEYYSYDVPCDGSKSNPDYLAIAEWLNLRDWLKKFPTGILSIVSDTFNLWKLITFILPRLKERILARNGKLVIRPDSGDPVDIICGRTPIDEVEQTFPIENKSEYKGVIELLWDIFGGTISKEGYKVLDPHIGAIYGDSINLERQVAIYQRLSAKEFAATNIVLGIGSFTYVYITRDSGGYAAKGAWFETGINKPDGISRTSYNIYKDPVTDDGTKKSLKGLICVNEDFSIKEECTFEEESEGLLQIIYEDGKFYNTVTLTEIRERINKTI